VNGGDIRIEDGNLQTSKSRRFIKTQKGLTPSAGAETFFTFDFTGLANDVITIIDIKGTHTSGWGAGGGGAYGGCGFNKVYSLSRYWGGWICRGTGTDPEFGVITCSVIDNSLIFKVDSHDGSGNPGTPYALFFVADVYMNLDDPNDYTLQ